jgi:hypothetical protein
VIKSWHICGSEFKVFVVTCQARARKDIALNPLARRSIQNLLLYVIFCMTLNLIHSFLHGSLL